MDFNISKINHEDKLLVESFITESWGSPRSVSRGKIYNIAELGGFICKKDSKIIGLITYNIDNSDCEIATLDSQFEHHGLGTLLINKVIDVTQKEGCKRVWLITTNDNSKAIRFYQRRGFEWVGFHKDAMKESRKLKPEIPEFGYDNIPIKHEIEFEYCLTSN